MICIGKDLDGLNLVVGRALHHGDMLPAKVKPEHGVAYVCHNGSEHMKHDFEVKRYLNDIISILNDGLLSACISVY